MSKVFKINTAVIICLAFIFRLYLINVGPISSLNSTEKNDAFLKAELSGITKKDTNVETSDNSKTFPAIEICEESSDSEDDVSKTSPFILLHVLYSSFTNNISLRSNILFDFFNHKISSKKYLAISVLRI